jgi:hypothetical protein
MLFTRKSFTNGIGRSQEQVQQFAKGVCALTFVVSPVLSSPLTVMTPENTEEDPHDPEPVHGDI